MKLTTFHGTSDYLCDSENSSSRSQFLAMPIVEDAAFDTNLFGFG